MWLVLYVFKSCSLYQEALLPSYNNVALSNLHAIYYFQKNKPTLTDSPLVTRILFLDEDFKDNS